MTQPFIGQIQLFGFNFAPRGWALCQGQTLPISQYAALFSILGTNFGGNGINNFMLPNMQGYVTVGAGQAPGLSPYVVGQTAGTTSVNVSINEMANHNHNFAAASSAGTTTTAAGNQLAYSQISSGGKGGTTQTAAIYSPNASAATTALAPLAIGMSGGNLPHNNMQPYLALNYCIALAGDFPSRN
jgi:microcystin-dependent protein